MTGQTAHKTGFVTVLCVCILGVFVIGSCFSSRDDDSGLTYWSSNNPEEIEFARDYVGKWNNKNPHSPVSFQPIPEGQSSEEIILAAVVGNTTPDIYANMWQGDVEDYARAGVLVALDTLPGFMDFMSVRCSEAVLEEVTSTDGHIYQVPWKVNPIMMLHNARLFEEAAVYSVPETYGEFMAAAERVVKDRNNDGHFDLWMGATEVSAIWWQRLFNFVPLYYAASRGGAIVENERAAFDNEHAVAVFRFLQEVYKAGYFPKEQMKGQSDPFLAQKIAVRFTGPWSISQIQSYMRDEFSFDYTPMPVPDNHEGPVYTYCDPKNIVIFNSCDDPQAAWEFLRTMLTAEADLEFLKVSRQLPRRQNLLAQEDFAAYFRENPQMLPFANQVQYLKGIDSSPNMKEVLDLISQEYEACVVFGKKSAEQAIADAAQAVNLLYLK